ncbi:hypothetical protein Y1Q_0009091 [Alligator mississippiensis]|uniref:Uncharacterized protein n=1 Tax=Alligator mississippiensis TaxID=8496 RepID=A0A151M285_ALLMI|nr:hypothetical protein Y1Q_0009091 [Alligator mississippiensis]
MSEVWGDCLQLLDDGDGQEELILTSLPNSFTETQEDPQLGTSTVSNGSWGCASKPWTPARTGAERMREFHRRQ